MTQSSNPTPSLTTGTLSCAALSQDPLLVLRGQVQFFSIDRTLSDATNFVYKLTLLSTRGEILYLTGCKKLDSNMSWSISNTWKATTTLYTTLSRDDGSLAGRGVLRISWRNFESELKSFAPTTSEKGFIAGLVPTLGFLGYFARSTANYFLGPFRDLEYARNLSTNGYLPKTPPAETVTLTAKDGVQTTIRVWNPQGEKIAGRKLPLLFFPGAAVTHEIFALPTIEVNTVEFFTSRGYTVYVPNLRFGAVPSSEVGYTAYEARLDVRAAAEFVRSRHDGRKMYVLCHCVGAIATASALLDGTLPASWLQGLTASQVFLAQWVGAVNALAARTSSLTKLYTVRFDINPAYLTIGTDSNTTVPIRQPLLRNHLAPLVAPAPTSPRPGAALLPRRRPRRALQQRRLPPPLLRLQPSLGPRQPDPLDALAARQLRRRRPHAPAVAPHGRRARGHRGASRAAQPGPQHCAGWRRREYGDARGS